MEQTAVEAEDPYAFEQIKILLEQKGVQYTLLEHAPCKTSEESANARGVSLASGAKAMLLHEQKAGVFVLAVMSASRKLSWKLMKQVLNSKKVELAKAEDVLKLTRCLSGAVPPFGSIFTLKTYCDKSLIQQGETINFNCGLRTRSMGMSVKEYLESEKPEICEFTEI